MKNTIAFLICAVVLNACTKSSETMICSGTILHSADSSVYANTEFSIYQTYGGSINRPDKVVRTVFRTDDQGKFNVSVAVKDDGCLTTVDGFCGGGQAIAGYNLYSAQFTNNKYNFGTVYAK